LYLKEIEIKGFKSFANKIKLSITPGITVIVGPNGCGKSNITDAVRWILGEQNIHSLRGNNLTDMIFAGNNQQKMRNFAEVSILFDNFDRKFELDSEQVEIKRTVFRSGNTENYINGIPCKLRDIHNLFLGTGLGKNSYSIIAQGKVDFVLNSKPSERRILFEEAANISSYKNKKENTIKRLDSVKSNLIRINDILSEVKENLNYYRKKADDLNLYYSYRDYIKKSEFYLLSQQYLLYEKNIIKYDKMLKNLKDELKTIEKILNNCKMDIPQIENKKILLEKQLDGVEKSFQANESEKINCNNQLILLKQKQSEIVQRIKNIQDDIGTSNEQYKKFQETIISIEKDIQEADSNHSVIAQNKNSYDVLLKKYNVILNNYSKVISVIKDNEKYFTEQYINKYREQKIKEETMVRSIDYSLQDIKKEYLSISNELQNNKKWLHDIENNLTDYENEKTSLQQEKIYLEKSLNKSKLIVEEEENILRNFNNDIILKNKEKDFLVELVKNQPNKENAINEYILKISDFKNQIVNFSEIIEKIQFIPDNLKDIIHFILNDKLDILLANSTDIVSVLNNILKTNNIGQAQLITDDIFEKEKYETLRNNIGKEYNNQAKVLGFANELIKYPSKYDFLFKILLGHILIVEDIDTAISIYKPQKGNLAVISLDGIFIDINGIITLNTFSENGKTSNIVLPTAKIEQLDREILSIKNNLTKHENTYNNAKNESQLFLKRIKEIDNKINIYLNKINKNNNNIIEINKNISEIEKKLKSLNLKKNAALDKKQYLNKDIDVSQSSIEKILNYNHSVKNYYNCILKIRNICNNSIESMQKKIENSKMEISWDQERKSLLQKRKVEMEHFIQTYHQEEQLRGEKLIKYNNEKSQLIKETDALENQLKKIIEKIKILDNKKNTIKETIREQETKLRKTHEDIEKYQIKYEERKNKYHENEMVKFQNQEKMNNLLSTIKEQYNSSVDEILMYKNELSSQKEAYTKIAKFKEKITAMGQLNFDALKEYKNQSDRHDDLQNKKNDIIQSKERLINLIKEIDRIAEQNFYKTFLKVENSFKDIFQKLFNGGQVSLELTNENKLLETGIEVMVQPPGKKLQNISLLSTGEKALTAIALLFALWKANPSPFCLFDEIDSALDESNAIRLANFLRNEDLKDAQIIIITHQRGVMESADALYGITMEGSGISKLMSVKILDTEEQEN
jgi:chromosome segregation protein